MNSGVQRDPQGEQAPSGGFAFGDILFTLFRHKFLILCSVVLGLGAAAVVRLVKPPNYESTAQIYVPYVVDLKAINPSDPNTPITPTGVGGDMVMSTEVDMLKSFDTAIEVAREIGAEKILALYGGGSNELSAAGVIASGINVAPPRTMSLTVTFLHRDPELVQPVMATIVKVYMHRHRKLRLGAGGDDFFVERRQESRKKLEGIEQELTTLKTNAGVPDLRERMSAVSKEYADIQSQVLTSQSELARRKAELGEFADLTNHQDEVIPADKISVYSEILDQIEEIKKRLRAELLDNDLTTNHPTVLKLEVKMQEQVRQRLALEQQFPALTNYISAGSRFGGGDGTNAVRFDLESEWAYINKLIRTIKSDEFMLVTLRDEAFRLMELEPKLTELERRCAAAKADYDYFRTSVEKSNNDSNSAGGVVQMGEMQKPTPPMLDKKKLLKLMGTAFGGCLGLGLGIAFLIDMVLDRSIRRPAQIVRSLSLPVVLTIPDSNRKESGLFSRRRQNGNTKLMRPDKTAAARAANALAPWSPDNQLQSHIEGLRERVLTYFEIKDLAHNPKLVAVTACMEGAGVTTLASGLAAALSRTGNGSVMLVDMNAGEGVTHSFYKGKPGFGPSESIGDDSENEEYSKDLSVAKISGGRSKQDRLAGMLPPAFDDIKPKLKASAYDYVVFDMTAISPASVTPRLSGHMDLVLFVIESEKTKEHTARHASELMCESRANVLAILNKYHNPVPSWLSHD